MHSSIWRLRSTEDVVLAVCTQINILTTGHLTNTEINYLRTVYFNDFQNDEYGFWINLSMALMDTYNTPIDQAVQYAYFGILAKAASEDDQAYNDLRTMGNDDEAIKSAYHASKSAYQRMKEILVSQGIITNNYAAANIQQPRMANMNRTPQQQSSQLGNLINSASHSNNAIHHNSGGISSHMAHEPSNTTGRASDFDMPVPGNAPKESYYMPPNHSTQPVQKPLPVSQYSPPEIHTNNTNNNNIVLKTKYPLVLPKDLYAVITYKDHVYQTTLLRDSIMSIANKPIGSLNTTIPLVDCEESYTGTAANVYQVLSLSESNQTLGHILGAMKSFQDVDGDDVDVIYLEADQYHTDISEPDINLNDFRVGDKPIDIMHIMQSDTMTGKRISNIVSPGVSNIVNSLVAAAIPDNQLEDVEIIIDSHGDIVAECVEYLIEQTGDFNISKLFKKIFEAYLNQFYMIEDRGLYHHADDDDDDVAVDADTESEDIDEVTLELQREAEIINGKLKHTRYIRLCVRSTYTLCDFNFEDLGIDKNTNNMLVSETITHGLNHLLEYLMRYNDLRNIVIMTRDYHALYVTKLGKSSPYQFLINKIDCV